MRSLLSCSFHLLSGVSARVGGNPPITVACARPATRHATLRYFGLIARERRPRALPAPAPLGPLEPPLADQQGQILRAVGRVVRQLGERKPAVIAPAALLIDPPEAAAVVNKLDGNLERALQVSYILDTLELPGPEPQP